jgi:hypothetical protein
LAVDGAMPATRMGATRTSASPGPDPEIVAAALRL